MIDKKLSIIKEPELFLLNWFYIIWLNKDTKSLNQLIQKNVWKCWRQLLLMA